MKADLSLPANQEAFRALYLNQHVRGSKELPVLEVCHIKGSSPLSLRPISSLTEEEMKDLICATETYLSKDQITECILSVSHKVISYTYQTRGGNVHTSIFVNNHLMRHLTAEWLQENSFLIPYRGDSCEEIIEAGLAVYREEAQS